MLDQTLTNTHSKYEVTSFQYLPAYIDDTCRYPSLCLALCKLSFHVSGTL